MTSMEVAIELIPLDQDILAALGRQDEAIDYWRRALELDPENEDLQRKLQE